MVATKSWVELLVGVTTLCGVTLLVMRHLVKYYLSELLPDGNGQSNLRGRIDRIENRVDDIYKILVQHH